MISASRKAAAPSFAQSRPFDRRDDRGPSQDQLHRSANGRGPGSKGFTAHVAIVDDDRLVRSGLSSLIRSTGLNATTFASAREFLDAPERFDCLISDVQMPEMSGIDLLGQVMARPYPIPVILMTGYVDPTLESRALNAGAIHLFWKSDSQDELLSILEDALRTAAND